MIKIDYQPKQVRIFLALSLALMIFLTFKFTGHAAVRTRVGIIGLEFIGVGILAAIPRAFFPVYRIILTGSSYLGNFIFTAVSLLAFFLILTPLALAMRLFGKKFMSVPIAVALPTYYDEAEDDHDVQKQY
jgi:hypothetical protein